MIEHLWQVFFSSLPMSFAGCSCCSLGKDSSQSRLYFRAESKSIPSVSDFRVDCLNGPFGGDFDTLCTSTAELFFRT